MPTPRKVKVLMADDPGDLPTYEEMIAETMQKAALTQTPPRQPPGPGPGPSEEPPDEDIPFNPEPPEEPGEDPGLTGPEGENNGGNPQPAPPPRDLAPPAAGTGEKFVFPLSSLDPSPALSGEILGPAENVRYESRITILEAWQYPGNVLSAPPWVDRNWIGYQIDYDAVRGIGPGPCVRVPLSGGVTAIARIGDYLTRQEMRLSPELSDIRIECWPRENFEKFFIPAGVN
jgi:hypothetical protein